MPEPILACDIVLQAGALRVEAQFSLTQPWTCLFGPSGSGKSSILRALAGHLRPLAGSLHLHGTVLLDRASRVDVPAHRRAIRSAPQSAWLFPGTVRDNLRYGVSTRQRDVDAEVVPLFGLQALLDQPGATLSGGQQQRVSLARTVAAALGAPEPCRLLLLDEPFTGLDLLLRNQLASDLRAFLGERRLPVLSVTHDMPETLLLEAEVLRLAGGRVAQQGPAAKVLAPERELLLQALQSGQL